MTKQAQLPTTAFGSVTRLIDLNAKRILITVTNSGVDFRVQPHTLL